MFYPIQLNDNFAFSSYIKENCLEIYAINFLPYEHMNTHFHSTEFNLCLIWINVSIAVAANAAAEEARKVAGITNNLGGGGDASDCPCAALMETGPESWGLEMLECCNLKKVWHFLDCGGGGTQISETNNGHRLHGRLDLGLWNWVWWIISIQHSRQNTIILLYCVFSAN